VTVAALIYPSLDLMYHSLKRAWLLVFYDDVLNPKFVSVFACVKLLCFVLNHKLNFKCQFAIIRCFYCVNMY